MNNFLPHILWITLYLIRPPVAVADLRTWDDRQVDVVQANFRRFPLPDRPPLMRTGPPDEIRRTIHRVLDPVVLPGHVEALIERYAGREWELLIMAKQLNPGWDK